MHRETPGLSRYSEQEEGDGWPGFKKIFVDFTYLKRLCGLPTHEKACEVGFLKTKQRSWCQLLSMKNT